MSIFSSIPKPRVKKTRFNMTHDVKLTVNMGDLVPYMCREVLPGDVWNVSSDFFVRYAPMLAPIMHRVDIRTECFFVPNRLIWKGWQDFITGGRLGADTTIPPYVRPSVLSSLGFTSQLQRGTLWDYMGLPTLNATADEGRGNVNSSSLFHTAEVVNIFPFLAYQMIWQEYYRDQNLRDEDFEFPLSENIVGDLTATSSPAISLNNLFRLRKRCWEKDYFTGSLPFTQRGVQMTLPLGASTDGRLNVEIDPDDTQAMQVRFSGSNGLINSGNVTSSSTGNLQAGGNNAVIDPNGRMYVDVSNANVTINDLRRTSAIQRWLENNARGGSRYIEQILAHFGVISSDSRLQRPEYLGGGSSPSIISEVLQTSETQNTPQGNMAGHGLAGGVNHGCLRKFEEHGYVVCLMTIRPRSSYVQGIEPMFRRLDKFDYAWPELAHLGEQPVYTTELYTSSGTNPSEVFGYVPRYADYKYINSRTLGEFRESMDYWHLSRKFMDKPALSEDFMEIKPNDQSRIFSAGELADKQQLYVHVNNRVHCTRRLPKYGVPYLE